MELVKAINIVYILEIVNYYTIENMTMSQMNALSTILENGIKI